jgi:hypothetical protein
VISVINLVVSVLLTCLGTVLSESGVTACLCPETGDQLSSSVIRFFRYDIYVSTLEIRTYVESYLIRTIRSKYIDSFILLVSVNSLFILSYNECSN